MKTEFIEWLIKQNAKVSYRFVDWSEGAYTPPVLLTEDRADKLYDLSIEEIRFTF